MGLSFSDVGYGKTKHDANAACAACIAYQGFDVIYPYNGSIDKMLICGYGVYHFQHGPYNNKTYASKAIWEKNKIS